MVEVYDDVDNLPKNLIEIEFLREHPQILQKLIDYSESKSLEPFVRCYGASEHDGGFHWSRTSEGKDFWSKVLTHRDTNHFYKKYPKISIPDLAEIKQKFPIGCTFNNNNLNKYGLDTDAENVKVTENAVFSREGDNWSIITKGQGNWTVYYNGHYADIITMESKIDPPYLLDVQKMFPIGTVFNNRNLLGNDVKQSKIIEKDDFLFVIGTWQYKDPEGLTYIIWKDGNYASIINDNKPKESKAVEDTLEIAKRKYPVGTTIFRDNMKEYLTKEILVTDLGKLAKSKYSNSIYYEEGTNKILIYNDVTDTWANIKQQRPVKPQYVIDQEKNALLTQAKMKFRKGVKFAINNLYPDNDTLYEIAQEPIFIRHSDGDILVKCVEEKNHIPRQVVVYCGRKKEWATIIGYIYDMETSGIGMNPFISEANAQKIITVQDAMQSTGKSIFPVQALQDRLDVLKLEYPLTPQESYKKSEFTIEPMKEIPIKEVSLDHIKFTIEKLK